MTRAGTGALGTAWVALMAGTSGALRVVRPATPPAVPGLWCYRLDHRRSVQGGALILGGASFSTLNAALVKGTIMYCVDCTIANPCAAGGTGAIAKKLNGVLVCN